jgi:hypothetical protein
MGAGPQQRSKQNTGAAPSFAVLVSSAQHGPVVQLGVHAALSRRRPRVQIPSGPLLNSPSSHGGRFGFCSRRKSWHRKDGRIAQLVERTPEKREVTGSTPVPTTGFTSLDVRHVPISSDLFVDEPAPPVEGQREARRCTCCFRRVSSRVFRVDTWLQVESNELRYGLTRSKTSCCSTLQETKCEIVSIPCVWKWKTGRW